MSTSDEQRAAAVDGIAKAVGLAATVVGQPVAGSLATDLGIILVDAITHGTLRKLVAHAEATAAVINSELDAELAARNRT